MTALSKDRGKYIAMVAACLVTTVVVAEQISGISGIPGDGIPDFYYYPIDNLAVTTSLGQVARTAGSMILDTDGADFVFGAISGPEPMCDLCDDVRLPGLDALANTSIWDFEYANGAAAWRRVAPSSGVDGFRGVVAEFWIDGSGGIQPWDGCDHVPFFQCPNAQLAWYPSRLNQSDFAPTFLDDAGHLWNAVFANNEGTHFLTNVTFVPETNLPLTGALTTVALMLLPTRKLVDRISNARHRRSTRLRSPVLAEFGETASVGSRQT